MPTYDFEDTNTGEVVELFMSISAREEYMKENPHMKSIIGAPALICSRGRGKPDDGFRDVLRKIKEGSGKGNTINTF